jgi:hypothetical protein
MPEPFRAALVSVVAFWPGKLRASVKSLAPLKLRENLGDALHPRLAPLRRLEAIINRVKILAVKGLKERLGGRHRLERIQKILTNG